MLVWHDRGLDAVLIDAAADAADDRAPWHWHDPDVRIVDVAVQDDRVVVLAVTEGRSVLIDLDDGIEVGRTEPASSDADVLTTTMIGVDDGVLRLGVEGPPHATPHRRARTARHHDPAALLLPRDHRAPRHPGRRRRDPHGARDVAECRGGDPGRGDDGPAAADPHLLRRLRRAAPARVRTDRARMGRVRRCLRLRTAPWRRRAR
ncbi:hypothetical protein JM654_05280 [Microbacterium oxydans]|nr:hypothetical protein [Microbacterium oxydans]